ncbi:Oligopeptidase A [Phycisphaerae bacterium RAS1]|nr:Oligopeptidase A [Phycisphaerae bacterium RAS1]
MNRHAAPARLCCLGCWIALTLAMGVASMSLADVPADSPAADALKKAEAAVAAIVAVPDGKRNFDNTVGAYDDMVVRLQTDTGFLTFMQHVSGDADERLRSQTAEEHITNWLIELGKREDLYKAIKAYAATNPKLEGEQKRLLEFTLRDYRRAGMDLPPEKREALKKIEMEINRLGIDFQKNIRDDETRVPLSLAELKGTPQDVIDGLPRSGDMYLAGLDYPTLLPIMDFCEVETTRHKMWLANHRKGGKKNVGVLEQILKLRAQAAALLGYKTVVDYETETRMTKNAETVKKFYEQVRPLVRKKSQQDYDEFVAVKRRVTGNPEAKLNPWDQAYYENVLKKEKYAVDAQKIQEFFPLDRVVDGLFGITQSLYGIEYVDVTKDAGSKGLPLWHPDVRVFEVLDKASKKQIGTFWIDLFPRDNKFSHAAQWSLAARKRWADGSVQKPLAALVCNFTKPTKEKPSLLTHEEVETFFHEFGHCLHSILTEADYGTFAGTACARDFVEAPSQMFENWVWDADVLATFARHYKSGEPFPKDLLAAMVKTRTLGKGLWAERQLYYGLLDLTYHLSDGTINTTETAQKLYGDVLLYEGQPETYLQAGFGHLIGYQSAYYGYMWSLVYAQDMFQRFAELGMLSPEAGQYYRKKILARGGTMDDMEMVKDYLGREPKMEAFISYLGLPAGKN